MQMNNILSFFLRGFHHIYPHVYGFILSLNAVLVVLFQFWMTRKRSGYPPLLVIMVVNTFYSIGFGMCSFVSSLELFLLAMGIITAGEMINTTVCQSLMVTIAPEEMQERYIAVFGLRWRIAMAIGPLADVWVIDNTDPNWVWCVGGIICIVAALGYLMLHARIGERFKNLIQQKDQVQIVE